MSLVFDGLWKTFTGTHGAQHVLRDVSLSVEPGEFVSLIGHSGCGKSTLLNMAGGLATPTHGTVTLDGAAITGPGPDRAMVFQNYSLLPRLSLIDNVRTAVRSARPNRDKQRIDTITERYLTSVGLWAHRDKKPHQVSGGMLQRTAVARAFAVEPRVLLLDEPFGALDALTRATLQAQLVELWQDETDTEIVVMVTHGIDEAVLLADRVVVMANPPGPSIFDTINVDLPRGRTRATAAQNSHFVDIQSHLLRILTALRDESLAA
jgi:nitrate ABC transporter ATP-binding subunit